MFKQTCEFHRVHINRDQCYCKVFSLNSSTGPTLISRQAAALGAIDADGVLRTVEAGADVSLAVAAGEACRTGAGEGAAGTAVAAGAAVETGVVGQARIVVTDLQQDSRIKF